MLRPRVPSRQPRPTREAHATRRPAPARLSAAAVAMLAVMSAIGVAGAAQGPRDASPSITVLALAVAETPDGLVGVHATIEATALAQGTGKVYVSTKPVAAADMQGSARLAAQVAAATLGMDWAAHDYLVSFRSDSPAIGGPSAGTAMALAFTLALQNLADPANPWQADLRVAVTGTIAPDGTVGPVGGVPAKAQAAQQAGVTRFLFPAGLETAADLRPTPIGLRAVEVDMQEHCRQLGLACIPVATLREVLAHAAGVQLAAPDAPVPATTDYAAQLSPSVQAQVDSLAARVAALPSDTRVDALAQEARSRLAEAQQALQDSRYYLAATRSFQGAIAAGQADAIAQFYAGGRQAADVEDWLSRCDDALAHAQQALAGQEVRGLNHLYAVGAAQQRAAEAQALRDQAQAALQRARLRDDWVESLQASVFCIERAGTVAWWAGLRDSFGAGPGVADLAGLADAQVEAAREMATYATAVMGGATAADALVASAQEHLAAGRPAAAIVEAAAAASQASVALQAPEGDVPPAVLEAARAGASAAVAQARAAGAEPILAVSLVELAGSQEDAQLELANLWTARTLALVDVEATPPPAVTVVARDPGAAVAPALAVGMLLGACAVAFLFAIVPPWRRR